MVQASSCKAFPILVFEEKKIFKIVLLRFLPVTEQTLYFYYRTLCPLQQINYFALQEPTPRNLSLKY